MIAFHLGYFRVFSGLFLTKYKVNKIAAQSVHTKVVDQDI